MFAYCNNNPENHMDLAGLLPSATGIYDNSVMLYGAANDRFGKVYLPVPDTPILDAVTEYLKKGFTPIGNEATKLLSDLNSIRTGSSIQDYSEYIQSLNENEFIHAPMATYKIISGCKKIKSGIELIVFPLPTALDELYGAIRIITGFNSVIRGIGKLFYWEE